MKKLLATLLLPGLALAQVPIRPSEDEPEPAPVQRPMRPARPLSPTPRPAVAPDEAAPAPAPRPAPGAAPSPRTRTAPAPAPAERPGAAEATITPANGRCVPMQGRFMLSFNKAEVVDVLEQASRWTCRNFIYTEDVARGKITLLSKTAVNAEEAYAAFLAALNANNIAIYPTGKYYRLGRAADGKKLPIPTYTDPTTGTPASEQVVTKVIRLHYADADQLRGVMGNFISPQGADIQSVPPDTLIITDIGLNIRRIERMIDAIDKVGGGDMVHLIQVRFASAKDVGEKVNQIFQAQGTGKAARRTLLATPGAPGPRGAPRVGAPGVAEGAGAVEVSAKVLADERTNKLIVIADEKSYQRILELVEQLDVPTSGEGGIHVVFLKNANAEEMATTLSNLAQGQAKKSTTATPPGVQGMPGRPGTAPYTPPQAPAPGDATAALFAGDVKITADKAQNALLVQASGADFSAISRLIEKLDRARRQVFVEAVIMEVNLNDETQLGVGGHYAVPFKYKGDNGVIPLVSQPGRVSSLNLGSVIQLGGFLTGFAGPVSAELKDLGLGNLSTLGILVHALQSNSDVNVLSTPHILATDNEESGDHRRPERALPGRLRAAGALEPPRRDGHHQHRGRQRPRPGRPLLALRAHPAPERGAAAQDQAADQRERQRPAHHRGADRGDREQRSPARPHHRQAQREDADRGEGPEHDRDRRPDPGPGGPEREEDPLLRQHPAHRLAVPRHHHHQAEDQPAPLPHAVHHPRRGGLPAHLRAQAQGAAGVPGAVLRPPGALRGRRRLRAQGRPLRQAPLGRGRGVGQGRERRLGPPRRALLGAALERALPQPLPHQPCPRAGPAVGGRAPRGARARG